MYAAAANRAAVIELLAAKGADLKATSKVTDLSSLTREGAGFGGNPQVPGAPLPARPAAGRPGGRRRCRSRVPRRAARRSRVSIATISSTR